MKLVADEEAENAEKIGLLRVEEVLTTARQVVEAVVSLAEMVTDVGCRAPERR
jgi:hypothetical protein